VKPFIKKPLKRVFYLFFLGGKNKVWEIVQIVVFCMVWLCSEKLIPRCNDARPFFSFRFVWGLNVRPEFRRVVFYKVVNEISRNGEAIYLSPV
jgi:hypothetical protein